MWNVNRIIFCITEFMNLLFLFLPVNRNFKHVQYFLKSQNKNIILSDKLFKKKKELLYSYKMYSRTPQKQATYIEYDHTYAHRTLIVQMIFSVFLATNDHTYTILKVIKSFFNLIQHFLKSRTFRFWNIHHFPMGDRWRGIGIPRDRETWTLALNPRPFGHYPVVFCLSSLYCNLIFFVCCCDCHFNKGKYLANAIAELPRYRF